MVARTLNLGILAHVDAGKTTLTERLLFAAGVIDSVGSVDAGTTQTDSLELERQRGITIRSAVASMRVDGTTVNLIDTPGHPDFIAEVERVLGVLDGVVLVISAVEGVQPQTRVLMRALKRLEVPTLVFVNKIDRVGARDEETLEQIRGRLTPDVISMGRVTSLGTPAAQFTAGSPNDDGFLESAVELLAPRCPSLLDDYVEHDTWLDPDRLDQELRAQVKAAAIHPLYFGSAITGAGTADLLAALSLLLPETPSGTDGPGSGVVFKIERGAATAKVVYVRMFAGTTRNRDRLELNGQVSETVKGISVISGGRWMPCPQAKAGDVARLAGLTSARVGDAFGDVPAQHWRHHFAAPTLQAVVEPQDPGDAAALHVALSRLAEEDPLIDVQQDDRRHELSVSLYGEVQKEVLQATLAREFGVVVRFRPTTTICIERPLGSGASLQVLHTESNPFLATIGLRIDPAAAGSGVTVALDVEARTVPLYAYRNLTSFAVAMDEYVREALREGLYGWQVTDCAVTMTRCGYSSPDGPPSTRDRLSTPADFRRLTPMVVMQALRHVGTAVCEPVLHMTLEVPVASSGAMQAALRREGAVVQNQTTRADLVTIEARLPVSAAQVVQRQLPAVTSGEGVAESRLVGHQAVRGTPPTRRRLSVNPLNRVEYVRSVNRPAQR